MAEIRRLAVGVRQAAIIEYLEEQVPAVGVGLFEFIQQHHRERLFADAVDQRLHPGFASLAENLGGGIHSLELAHVQSQHAIGRAEQELGQCLGQLRLAGPRGPREQKNANWLTRIDKAGLQHGDTVDQGADGLVLSHHALREEGSHQGHVHASPNIQDRGRKPGDLR